MFNCFIHSDASNFGLGGVLSQIQDDVEHVVAYCSHALRPSQRRYSQRCCGHLHPIPVVSLCALLGCTKTRTAPYHPESDGMIERFNRTCLMMLSMFVNDRRDNWNELLPYVMHAYRTSVHESTGYSPFCLMMGEECSLPQDVSTAELRTHREHDTSLHPFATWVRDALEVAYNHVRESRHRTAARRKRLYNIKAVNRKFPV